MIQMNPFNIEKKDGIISVVKWFDTCKKLYTYCCLDGYLEK